MRAVLKVLGVDHVRDTVVGNAAIRGVSGGQRRRVQIAEILMGKARVICGDEVTTGLDAVRPFFQTHALAVTPLPSTGDDRRRRSGIPRLRQSRQGDDGLGPLAASPRMRRALRRGRRSAARPSCLQGPRRRRRRLLLRGARRDEEALATGRRGLPRRRVLRLSEGPRRALRASEKRRRGDASGDNDNVAVVLSQRVHPAAVYVRVGRPKFKIFFLPCSRSSLTDARSFLRSFVL